MSARKSAEATDRLKALAFTRALSKPNNIEQITEIIEMPLLKESSTRETTSEKSNSREPQIEDTCVRESLRREPIFKDSSLRGSFSNPPSNLAGKEKLKEAISISSPKDFYASVVLQFLRSMKSEFVKREELMNVIGKNSKSTLSRAIKRGENLGWWKVQSYFSDAHAKKNGKQKAGMYFTLL